MTNTDPTAEGQVFATTHAHLRAAFDHLEEAIKALSGASDAGLGDELGSTTDNALLELGNHRGSVTALVLWTQRMAEGLAKHAGTPPATPPGVCELCPEAPVECVGGTHYHCERHTAEVTYLELKDREGSDIADDWWRQQMANRSVTPPPPMATRDEAASFVNSLVDGGGTNISD